MSVLPARSMQCLPIDGPFVTLATVSDAVACLRVRGLRVAAATAAAGTRACVVYATKSR